MKTIGLDISVLNESKRTGIGVYTYELVKALLKVNTKDRFVLFGLTPLATFEYMSNLDFKNFPNVEMKIYRMPARLFRRVFVYWQKLDWPPIERLIGDVDIFHSFNWVLPPQKGGKVVATIFDLTAISYPQWHLARTSQLDLLRFSRIKDKADLVLAISQSSKKDFLGFSKSSKVDVIYPAAAEIFATRKSSEQKKKVLAKYNLQEGFVLSVSTLEPRKNIIGLVKAYLKAGIAAPLVLVGQLGWKSEELISLVNKNLSRIKLVGFVPEADLPIFFQAALFLVYPSFYEGFGIPVLEAMYSECPVICSDNSSLPEAGGEAVIYINPYSIDSMAKKIKELSADQKKRQYLTRLGLKQARKFSWISSARKLDKLYQSL